MTNEIIQYQLFVNKRKDGFVQPNGILSGQNTSDFYINIPIYLSYKLYNEYINIDKDKTTTIINRQNINPFFIELGFFNSIKATGHSGNTNSYSENEIINEKSKKFNITINK